MAGTVTAQQGGSTSIGMAISLKVITGQAASPLGTPSGATNTTPSLSYNPAGTGSWIYGANLGLSGTYTANGSTTYQKNVAGGGLQFIHMRTTSTTTSGSPVTVGGTAGVNSISISLLEILAGSGLAEDASSPSTGGFSSTTSITTGSFTPPNGSLLVLMVTTNGGGSVTTMGVTDTLGLGLTWSEKAPQQTAGDGYSGIWIGQFPSVAAATPAPLVVPSLAAMQAASW